MKVIIGIDPGSVTTGYGILKFNNKNIYYIFSGYISLKDKNLFNRLKIIYNEIYLIIKKFKPDYSVIEQVFVGKNMSSALKLSHARSAIIVALMNLNIPIYKYSFLKIRKFILKSNLGKKSEIHNKIKSILNIPFNLKYDVSDALAMAITHYYILLEKYLI